MMDLLEKVGYVILSWTTLSLTVAIIWSKVMSELHRKDHTLRVERQRGAWRSRQARAQLAWARQIS